MTATEQDLTIYSGDSHYITVTVTDVDGAAKNLVGATVKYQAGQAITKASGGHGIAITDPAAGQFVITLEPDDTKDLVGIFAHEAEVTDSSDDVSTVLVGRLTIKEDLIE